MKVRKALSSSYGRNLGQGAKIHRTSKQLLGQLRWRTYPVGGTLTCGVMNECLQRTIGPHPAKGNWSSSDIMPPMSISASCRLDWQACGVTHRLQITVALAKSSRKPKRPYICDRKKQLWRPRLNFRHSDDDHHVVHEEDPSRAILRHFPTQT